MARSKKKPKKAPVLELPPLPHAKAHRELLAELAQMSPEELFQTLVDAGIYTKDRKLTKAYRTPRDAGAVAE